MLPQPVVYVTTGCFSANFLILPLNTKYIDKLLIKYYNVTMEEDENVY